MPSEAIRMRDDLMLELCRLKKTKTKKNMQPAAGPMNQNSQQVA